MEKPKKKEWKRKNENKTYISVVVFVHCYSLSVFTYSTVCVYKGERARLSEGYERMEYDGYNENNWDNNNKNIRSLQHVLIECHHFEVHKYTKHVFARVLPRALTIIQNAGNCCSLFARLRGMLFVMYVHMQTIYRKLCGKTIVKEVVYNTNIHTYNCILYDIYTFTYTYTYTYTSIHLLQLSRFCVWPKHYRAALHNIHISHILYQ